MKQYHARDEYITWENCTLRAWLNDEFLATAFTEEEQRMIQTSIVSNEDNPKFNTEGGSETEDKIFLLSIEEVSNPSYGFSENLSKSSFTRQAENTIYTLSKNAVSDIDTDVMNDVENVSEMDGLMKERI